MFGLILSTPSVDAHVPEQHTKPAEGGCFTIMFLKKSIHSSVENKFYFVKNFQNIQLVRAKQVSLKKNQEEYFYLIWNSVV